MRQKITDRSFARREEKPPPEPERRKKPHEPRSPQTNPSNTPSENSPLVVAAHAGRGLSISLLPTVHRPLLTDTPLQARSPGSGVPSTPRTPASGVGRPVLSDQKDDMVLEAAVNGQCRYIVTFNVSDFAGADRFAVEPIRPRDFLIRIGELK